MPGSSAKGLAHLPTELFPTSDIPASVLENLPIGDVLSAVQPQGGTGDAPGLSHFPTDLFPPEHFPDVAIDYLPIADLFGL